MRPGANILERSLAELTIGVHNATKRRAEVLRDGHTGEWEQQIRVPIAGRAGDQWGHVDQAVTFELPFLYAPLQRAVPFDKPHFSHGFEFVTMPPTLVLLQAHVVQWTVSEENWCVGANVRFAVCAPLVQSDIGLGQVCPFDSIAHLTFQGYSTMPEADEFGAGGVFDS